MKNMSSDPAVGFRFSVEINNQAIAAFTECTMPSFQVKTDAIQEGGQNAYKHELPGFAEIGHVTLKHGLVTDDVLLKWYLQMLSGTLDDQAFRDVTINMYNNNHHLMYSFQIAQAYPVKWEGPSFRASESAIAIESLELSHKGITVVAAPDIEDAVPDTTPLANEDTAADEFSLDASLSVGKNGISGSVSGSLSF